MNVRTLAAAVLATCSIQTADAQTLSLAFDAGRVSLSAQGVPLRQILVEWARLGGATIVNGEDVTGPPVTLLLEDVPERQALDILLRGVAGYILVPRAAEAASAAAFDRIVIVATSAAPRVTAPPPGFQAPRPVQVARPDQSADEPPVDPTDGAPEPADSIAPEPRPNTGVREVPVIPRPFDGVPQGEAPQPTPGGTAPSPANPFGLPFGTTSRPGVITPAPQQPNPNVRPDPGP